MRKAVSLIITALMFISMLAACGQSDNITAVTTAAGQAATETTAAGTPEVTKAMVQFWGHVNEAWNNSHRATVAKFNSSQSNIEVVATFFPYDDFEVKIQTSLMSGGSGADVYEIWGGWGLDFVAGNALSAVPDVLIADLVNDCYKPVLGAFKGGDQYYGVPVEFNIEYGGMLLNKTKFEEMDIAYPETWEQIINVARQTSISNGELMDMRGLDFTTDDTLTTTFLSMILSSGGQYFVDGKFKLTTPEAENALQTLVDYVVVDHLTNLDSATGAQGAEIDGHHFLGRDEAMIVPRGPWVISGLLEDYGKEYGVDFDYKRFPFYGSIPAFPAETGWSLCVPESTKVADAAWEYVTYFLEADNLLQHNINCAQVPPRKSVVSNPEFVEQLPYMEPLLGVLEYGKFIGPFNTDVLKISLRGCYVSLCSNDGTYQSVADALAKLETQLNTDLRLQ